MPDHFRTFAPDSKGGGVIHVKEQLIFSLYRYNLEMSDIDLIFISPDLDEETFMLTDEEVIDIPVGKFLTILSLEGVSND